MPRPQGPAMPNRKVPTWGRAALRVVNSAVRLEVSAACILAGECVQTKEQMNRSNGGAQPRRDWPFSVLGFRMRMGFGRAPKLSR